MPAGNPRSERAPLYSQCHPSAAFLVPYMCLRRSPHSPRSRPPSSLGSSTYVGSSGSVLAQKYARAISTKEICVLDGLFGSRTCSFSPFRLVAARLKTVLRLSRGGVGANIGSSPFSQYPSPPACFQEARSTPSGGATLTCAPSRTCIPTAQQAGWTTSCSPPRRPSRFRS